MSNLTDLVDCIEKCSNKRLLVIGDLILDHYVWGDVNRISPEAPVPVVEYQRESYVLGGAANVANNIAALGFANVELCGLIGKHDSATFLQLCRKNDIGTSGVVQDPGRLTTTKTRIVAHNQQIVRLDRESKEQISPSLFKKIRKYIEHSLADVIIISDYLKGVVSDQLMDLVRTLNKPVIVDPKNPKFDIYRDVTIILPNLNEAALGAMFKIVDDNTLVQAGTFLRDKLNLKAVLVTRGDKGMSLFENEIKHFPTLAKNVCDVSGAGDTVTALIAIGLASGLSFADSAYVANVGAGLVVEKFGTSTVSLEEIRNSVR